jgi:hypothetical protein
VTEIPLYINVKQYLCSHGTKALSGLQYLANKGLNPNSVALVGKRTIPTERQLLVGEVSAKLLRIGGVAWSAQPIPTAVNLGFLDPEQGL